MSEARSGAEVAVITAGATRLSKNGCYDVQRHSRRGFSQTRSSAGTNRTDGLRVLNRVLAGGHAQCYLEA